MKKGDISFDDGFFIMDLARQFEGTIASDSATDWTFCFNLKTSLLNGLPFTTRKDEQLT